MELGMLTGPLSMFFLSLTWFLCLYPKLFFLVMGMDVDPRKNQAVLTICRRFGVGLLGIAFMLHNAPSLPVEPQRLIATGSSINFMGQFFVGTVELLSGRAKPIVLFTMVVEIVCAAALYYPKPTVVPL